MSKIDSLASPAHARVGTVPLLLGALVLASLPWLSSLYQDGRLADSPREVMTSIAASLIAIAFAAWVILLLRRERATALRHLADLEALTDRKSVV